MARGVGDKDLGEAKKAEVANFLIKNSVDGQPRRGAISQAAQYLQVCRGTVIKIWAATKKNIDEGTIISFPNNRIVEHQDKLNFDDEKFKDLPLKKQSTFRRIAKGLGVSKSQVGSWFKKKKMKPHTSAIKPYLSAENKLLRMHFCLSSLVYDRDNNLIKFKGMHNIIHIDEKWFFITKTTERYYLLPDEEDPHRTCKSKRFITKVMFMSAVSRPIYSMNGELVFDGKIGLFPFTKQEPAQRNSKNRVRGTLETKCIEAITKPVIKECIISKIIPAIKSKWPANASKNIFIQQVNARPHIMDDDPDFRLAATSDGFNIHLICQPSNSPDTNINDLDFFRAIQSLQEETAPSNMDDLVRNVEDAYDQLTPTTLNNVFLSLQGCMTEIMKCKGDNTYKIPHMDKARLLRLGLLPDNLQVEPTLVEEVIEYLRQPGNEVNSNYEVDNFISDLGY